MAKLIKQFGSPFLGHVLSTLTQQGNSASRQMCYITYALKYHGLSRFGVCILAKLGNALPLSTMDDWSKTLHRENATATRYNTC